MWIRDLGLERLGALLVKESWRFDAGFDAELIFHADAPKDCHTLSIALKSK
jgi:hypothetical protein